VLVKLQTSEKHTRIKLTLNKHAWVVNHACWLVSRLHIYVSRVHQITPDAWDSAPSGPIAPIISGSPSPH